MSVFLIAAGCCLFALFAPTYLYISSCILLIFKNAILVFSICRFKSFIKTIEYAMPNQKLIRIHFSNVFIYTILYIISAVLYVFYEKRKLEGNEDET